MCKECEYDKEELVDRIAKLEGEVTRYKGIWGGVLLTIAAIVTIIELCPKCLSLFTKN